jgi:hypothetical protein
MKIGDLVMPVTREWDNKRYTILDIFVSEKNNDKLLQIGFIGAAGTPAQVIIDSRLFELAPKSKDNK